MAGSPRVAAQSDKRAQRRRKAHNKTRTGCSDCRRRRVKCTEEKPACRSCVRRQAECHYPPQDSPAPESPSAASRQNQSQTSRDQSQSIGTPPSAVAPGASHILHPATPASSSPGSAGTESFSLQEVALFHHWVTSTSLEFSHSRLADSLWQTEVPKIAFEHTFLFYAILSIAVLHRAHLQGQRGRSHVIAATHYHNEGLRLFQSELQRISPSNCEALFLWSALNALYILAVPRASYEEAIQARDSTTYDAWRDRVLGAEWIPLHRGITSLLNPEGVDLKQSRLSAIFILGNYFDLDPNEVDTGYPGRELMRSREIWADDTRADVYSETLGVLYRCLAFMMQPRLFSEELTKTDSTALMRALLFPIHCFTEGFLRLLRQRQPPALVLFAFFGAFLHRGRYYWALESWGKDIVRVTSELLGTYWRPWIQWPLHVIEDEDN